MITTRCHASTPDALVELLCAPTRDQGVGTGRLREVLLARLAATFAADPRRARRLDAFIVEHGALRFTEPFAWTARAARRPLGTAAARRLGGGAAATPLDAAREEVERLCDRAARGLARRGALSTWLAGSPPEVRALCAAEAASWATRLMHLCEPGARAARVSLGEPDAYVDVPTTRTTLVGRRDATTSHAGRTTGILRVRDGVPGRRAADGLVVDALVAGLADPASAVLRAVGAWPDAGVVLAVDLDDDARRHGARLLVATAASLASAPSRHDVATLAA